MSVIELISPVFCAVTRGLESPNYFGPTPPSSLVRASLPTTDVGSIIDQRRRRWPYIDTTSGQQQPCIEDESRIGKQV